MGTAEGEDVAGRGCPGAAARGQDLVGLRLSLAAVPSAQRRRFPVGTGTAARGRSLTPPRSLWESPVPAQPKDFIFHLQTPGSVINLFFCLALIDVVSQNKMQIIPSKILEYRNTRAFPLVGGQGHSGAV